MPSLKPTIDSKQRITIFPEEGLIIPVAEKNPATNEYLDISGLTLSIHLASGFEKPLDVDPDNPLGRRILLTHEELKTHLPASGSRWALVDESGEVPVTLSYGEIVWQDPSWID